MSTINLEEMLVTENRGVLVAEEKVLVEQAKLDIEAQKITRLVEKSYQEGLANELGFEYSISDARRIQRERQDFACLPQNRIMSTDAIKAVCVKFGLRFLPTRFYRGSLDDGIGPAVANLKAILGGRLPAVVGPGLLGGHDFDDAVKGKPQFCIAAPSAAFALQPRPQDPLLFLRLNAIKWYLVHKWGDDLKTADIRKGEVNDGNWNSPINDRGSVDPLSLRNSIMVQPNMFTTATSSLFNNSFIGQSSWSIGTSTTAT